MFEIKDPNFDVMVYFPQTQCPNISKKKVSFIIGATDAFTWKNIP